MFATNRREHQKNSAFQIIVRVRIQWIFFKLLILFDNNTCITSQYFKELGNKNMSKFWVNSTEKNYTKTLTGPFNKNYRHDLILNVFCLFRMILISMFVNIPVRIRIYAFEHLHTSHLHCLPNTKSVLSAYIYLFNDIL